MESAKLHKNMLTGLVVTSRITHATPAAFSAHVAWRDWENDIALQQIGENPLGRTVDLMFGGGRCQFITNKTEGGCRLDDRNLIEEAKSKYGWNTILDSRKQFDALADDAQLPLMGLYTPDVSMIREIDFCKLCDVSSWITDPEFVLLYSTCHIALTEIPRSNLRWRR